MRTTHFNFLAQLIFACLCLPLFVACGSNDSSDGPEKPSTEPETPSEVTVGPPEGKEVYIPQELRTMDLKNKDSQWYWGRTKATDDVILFWAKGFGDDISKAPSLQGQNMKVDADNLLRKVQEFYDFYYNELKFVNPGETNADRYRMMVMLDYSLEGTAYGGTYDNVIGALWVAPNRVQDENMNAVAHELGHSFQLQIIADGAGAGWGDGFHGFYEMTSQWMLWQVNPDWTSDEYYHFEAFRGLTHKAYLHLENIYHSPFVIECWGEQHGLPFIANLYREGRNREDVVETYKRLTGVSQEEFNAEMWHNYARLVNFDFDRVRSNTRRLTDGWNTQLANLGDGWKRVAKNNAPENYGFNVIPVTAPEAGATVTVEFRGEAGLEGYVTRNADAAGWRYGFVAVDSSDNVTYGEMQSDPEGSVSYTLPEGTTLRKLWLVVMGAPTRHWQNNDNSNVADDAQWPYSIKINY